ncbi:fimbrial protein [Serratia rubidaea]|nr:fimbrial protein [Serratia rubidaea]MDC6117164.1 fimbrial protein [Serratia rubidaea]
MKKIAYILFLPLILLAVDKSVASEKQGWGRVSMVGTIIESACAIDTVSRDQTINMGVIPISQIARDGQGTQRSFSIRLINCIQNHGGDILSSRRNFQITFDGSSVAGVFSINGSAKGVSLQIADEKGNIVTPGRPLPFGSSLTKPMLLNYSLRLVNNHRGLRAGEYSSTVKFKMDYY